MLVPPVVVLVLAAWMLWRSVRTGAETAVSESLAARGLAAVLAVAIVAVAWHVVTLAVFQGQRPTSTGLERATFWMSLRGVMEARGFEGASSVAANNASRALGYAAAFGLAERATAELPVIPEDDRTAWSNASGRWHVVRVRYPFRPGFGRHPAVALVAGLVVGTGIVLLQRTLLDIANGYTLAEFLDDNVPDQAGIIRDVALGCAAVLLAPLLWMVWLVVAGAFDLFATIERRGLVVRARRPQRVVPHPWLLGPLARRDRYSLFVAVDDGRSDRVSSWLANERTAVPQGVRAREGDPAARIRPLRRADRDAITVDDGILVTNDDGIASTGLHVLARTMRRHGDVVVVAPEVEHSGAGAGVGPLHLINPMARTTTIEGIEEAWCLNGSPALCTMFARFGLFGPIDLVVSGINPGANVGRAIYHSGTVGAALTARSGSVSGVAVSQAVAGFGVEGQGWDEMIRNQRWQTAADVASAVVGELIAAPPADPVVVNINVPNLELEDIEGWRHAEVAATPPRALTSATLEPVTGKEGCYAVRMEFGDPIIAPPDTDSGAIERDEVAVTYLSRLQPEPRDDLTGVDHALESLLGSVSSAR